MSLKADFLIYSGIMPLIKTFITIFFGYVLAKKGLFPSAASRGASSITMNIALPCLIFASMVPAFNNDNISAIGPLLLLATIYICIGFTFGILIREFFYVPRNFWQGLLILTALSNWGNLPNAIVITVTQQEPFDPSTDTALGVSYVSVFSLVVNLVFFGFGGANSLAWDYATGIPQGDDAGKRYRWHEKPIGSLIATYLIRRNDSNSTRGLNLEATPGRERDSAFLNAGPPVEMSSSNSRTSGIFSVSQRVSEADSLASNTGLANPAEPSLRTRRLSSNSLAIATEHGINVRDPDAVAANASSYALPTTMDTTIPEPNMDKSGDSTTVLPLLRRILDPIIAILHPITIATMISILCALVPQLKALFVSASDIGGPDWKGPDNRPPLVVVYDTCDFVGALAVPMGLILLGASFDRMKVPRPLSRLPIAAMLASAVGKLFLLPVIGVFVVQAMVRRGLIPEDAKAEKFVNMFLSGTPPSVNQLIASSLHSPDGELDTLTAFLLINYALMFFSSAALSAVSLLLL